MTQHFYRTMRENNVRKCTLLPRPDGLHAKYVFIRPSGWSQGGFRIPKEHLFTQDQVEDTGKSRSGTFYTIRAEHA